MHLYLIYSRKPDGTEAAGVIAEGLTNLGHDVVWRMILPPTDPGWADEVTTGMESADWVIVIITSTLRGLKVQMKEIVYAQSQDKPILVVIAEQGDVPINLLSHKTIDVSENLSNGANQILDTISSVEGLVRDTAVDIQPASPTEIAEAKTKILGATSFARIFIAYSRKQRGIAQDLTELLVRNGKAVFWDAKIKAGATWRQTIQKALDDATHLIVIWTPDAAESDEVEREVSYALTERKVIVPILSKEIPKLPYHLHGLHYIILEEDLNKIETSLLNAIAQYSDGEDIWQ